VPAGELAADVPVLAGVEPATFGVALELVAGVALDLVAAAVLAVELVDEL
jgi:hypothetical protein